jgi:hypothetical protein
MVLRHPSITKSVFITLAALSTIGELAGAFNSASWLPTKPPPWKGALARNKILSGATLLAKGKILGPEDVAVDARGRIYCGSLKDGKMDFPSFHGH